MPIIFSDWKRASLGDGSRAEKGPESVKPRPSGRARPSDRGTGAFHEGVSSSEVPAGRTASIGPDSSREPARSDGEGGTADSNPGDTGTPGAPDGDPFGTDDRDAGSNFDRSGASEIIRIGGGVVAPKLVFRVEPAYSEAARALRAEGVVVLEAVISATGTVENVRVLRSAHPLLDASAVRAVAEWRYEPATLGHRAVRVYLTVTVSFALRG